MIFHAGKDVENRTWTLPEGVVGRRAAIHASSKRWPISPADILSGICGWGAWADNEIPELNALPVGVLLGTVLFTGVTTDGRTPARVGKKSRWFCGPVGLIMEGPRLLAKPIPARGMLGFWQVDPVAAEQLEALTGES
jgi:hypothetical protein